MIAIVRVLSLCLCVSALALGLPACEPVDDPGPTDPVHRLIEQRVPKYLRKVADLPPGVTAKVTDIKPSAVPGLLSATLELSQGEKTQKFPITLSRDGRYYIQGAVADLTVDPYEANAQKISLNGHPMRGNPNAAVTIVEYSDFQCPFCAKAYTMLEEQVLAQYGDRVRLVFKNFPLSSIHPWAEAAALATVCAREQSADGFWKLYDYLFQNQKEITAQNLRQKVAEVAGGNGLDVEELTACLDSEEARELVRGEEQEAVALGVRSTPTFFVNGRKVEGAVPFETFKTYVDAALEGSRQ